MKKRCRSIILLLLAVVFTVTGCAVPIETETEIEMKNSDSTESKFETETKKDAETETEITPITVFPNRDPVDFVVKEDVDDEAPTLYLWRKNLTTNMDIYFSNAARLEYWENEQWVTCPNSAPLAADSSFHALGPNEYEQYYYDIDGIDFSRDGTYRIVTAYSLTGNTADNVEVALEFKLGVNSSEYFKQTTALTVNGVQKTANYRFFGYSGYGLKVVDGQTIQEYTLQNGEGDTIPKPYVKYQTYSDGQWPYICMMLFDSAEYLAPLKSFCWRNEWKRSMKQYDESFFDDKVFLLVTFEASSGSYFHVIQSIAVQGETLFIDVMEDSPSDCVTHDMANPMLLIELDRADVLGCTQYEMTVTRKR